MKVLTGLRAAGHSAFFAGGCVRDKLLRRVPKDYDVATDATPDEVLKLFPRARQVGAQFGVVLVRKYGHDIEVATFRADGDYSDGRHPDEVRFGDQVEDARRRDFTINGLFLDPIEDRIVDYVDGRADLTARLIRTIGDPGKRFGEDHLRMLRAVRFAAQLDFRIERNTMAAIKRLGPHLRNISVERIGQELDGILTSPTRASGWSLLLETGLRSFLLDRWKPNPDDDEIVGRRLAALPAEPISSDLALAAVWGSRDPVEVAGLSRGLRLSNRLSRGVKWLVGSRHTLRQCRSMELADLKLLMANEHWGELLELLRVDLIATGASPHRFEEVRDWAGSVSANDVAPPPLLDGNDLQELGFPPGPHLGRVLNRVYRAQLNGLIRTGKQARKLAGRLGTVVSLPHRGK